MKKVFSFLRSPRMVAMDSPTQPGSSGVGANRPLFREKDMGAIHKAASVGNVRKVKQILFFRKSSLNDRDRMSRTALHVACGKGFPRVVRLLTRRRCLLNLCDIDNKTALIHAIQYEQEECATILLDHGANPNVMDIHGNNALHYALLGTNTAIVEKLLSSMENMEARNKNDFTPFSVAKYGNKEKMVKLLVTNSSKADRMESHNKQQLTSEYPGERLVRSSKCSNLAIDLQASPKQALSKTKSKTVYEISEEDSLCRNGLTYLCCISYYKPRIIDSYPTSDHGVLKAEEKKEQKTSKREVSGNMDAGANDSDNGLSQQNNSGQTNKQQVAIMEDEDSYRFPLRKEKEKTQKADWLCEKNRVQLTKKEEHSIKEVKINPQLETIIRTQNMTLEIVRENEVVEEQNCSQSQLSQEQNTRILQDEILLKHLCKPEKIEIAHKDMNSEVSESSDREKSLLHENRMLWDAIAKLRQDIDTIKNQTQEKEKKYIEDIAVVKEMNDYLQKTITETVFQHNEQLEILRAECIMLNHKLENEEQIRGRLEAEVKSYRSRLATDVQDHEHCQKSERNLQLASQRARDEWICSQDKMNVDMSNLRHNNEILSQQLSTKESKSNSLEIEHHTRDALKQRTLVLERDLSQKQCQTEETEHVYEEEPGKVDKDFGKQESSQERLSHLESENMLPHQQLDQDHNKADREENTNDKLITKMQPSSSKCICLDKEKTPQQELSVEALLKRREELKDRVKMAKQEALSLRSHMERNMLESCEAEDYKEKIEEGARRDVADTVEQLSSFL